MRRSPGAPGDTGALALAAALLALGVLALAVPVSADTAPDCTNPATTADMVTCADADYRTADAALNETWKKTLGTVRAADAAGGGVADLVTKLREAQRAWLAWRDAECRLMAAQAYGGTSAPVLEITCLSDLTTDRTQDLVKIGRSFGPQ